jgi:hypothetical protein
MLGPVSGYGLPGFIMTATFSPSRLIRLVSSACALTAFLAIYWLTAPPAEAQTAPLYLWSDRLTLYAAPTMFAEVVGELSYGEAVELLSAPGPPEPGGSYPWRRGNDEDEWYQRKTHPPRHPFFLHGHWLKLRSLSAPFREGYAFDSALLPLPAPRCGPGAAPCDPVTSLGSGGCFNGTGICESAEDYSARVFGQLSRAEQGAASSGPEHSVEIRSTYARDIEILFASAGDGLLQTKQWKLPMLTSLDQAYLVARRFFGDCWHLTSYDPAREIDLDDCGGIDGASVVLTRSPQGVLIDWSFMD